MSVFPQTVKDGASLSQTKQTQEKVFALTSNDKFVRQKETTFKNENKEIVRRMGKETKSYWYFKRRSCFSFLTTQNDISVFFWILLLCNHLMTMTGGYYAAVTASKCNKFPFPVFFTKYEKKALWACLKKPEGKILLIIDNYSADLLSRPKSIKSQERQSKKKRQTAREWLIDGLAFPSKKEYKGQHYIM